MDRIHFYEANKTGLTFFWFAMIFSEFCKIFVFIEKGKNQRKEKKKACMGFVQPITKLAQLQGFSPGWKRNPPGEVHLDLDILYQEPRSISKTIKSLSPFLSLWHLYIWNPVFLSILFPTPNLGNVKIIVNGRETEPVLGWTKKANFVSLVLGIDKYVFSVHRCQVYFILFWKIIFIMFVQ
jgi:hypothetical protein